MKSIFFSVLFLFISALASNAGCYTGSACSIEGLQTMQYVSDIENYFAKNAPEPVFIGEAPPVMLYNDLFLFNTIV